jgi:UDP-N-acetylmuramyl tripeptide synthase
MAQDQDIILVAGKGHETYQDQHGERLPFDDMQELTQNLKSKR